MTCKIVADSSANIYEREGVDFTSVPLKIVTAEREFPDIKGTDIPEMINYLQDYSGKSGTACPNVANWLEAFGDADLILGVTITSNLSGSFSSAMHAKRDYETSHKNAKVHIVDSLSAGPELELIIEKMEEVIQSGQSFKEMVHDLTDYCQRTHLLFALKNLDNLARNGRVSPAMARIARIMGIRIVGKASGEGTLQELHKCHGEAQSVSRVWEEMQRHGYNGGKVRLAHCLNPQIAKNLSDTIHRSYPKADVRITHCTALCSFYAEKGGLMIGYEGA